MDDQVGLTGLKNLIKHSALYLRINLCKFNRHYNFIQKLIQIILNNQSTRDIPPKEKLNSNLQSRPKANQLESWRIKQFNNRPI